MSNQLENEHLPLLDVNIEIDENEIDENVEFEGISPLNPPNGSSRKQSICFALAILIVFSFVLILTSCSKTLKKPLLIVISLDGCKPDYLTLGLTPTLTELTKIGFYSHLQPSFPSITFPNHVTLTSGLYPESHGIVGNSFYDPVLIYDDEFSYVDPKDDQDFKWWNSSVPIWITAEEQGLLAGNCFWPGSETTYNGKRSTFYKNYRSVPPTTQLEWVQSWLSKRESLRPSLITIYFPQIDHAGHGFGPRSDEVKTALGEIDTVIGVLIDNLKDVGLWESTNLVVVSDHGMGESSTDRVVFLDAYVDQDLFKVVINGPLWSIYPHTDGDVQKIYSLLATASTSSHFKVWLHDEIPTNFHYKSHRVGPILLLADPGYNFAFRKSFDPAKPPFPKGVHGWNITNTDMQAILIGAGPYFTDYSKNLSGSIKNVEVYGMLADILQIKPRPNNGTGFLIK